MRHLLLVVVALGVSACGFDQGQVFYACDGVKVFWTVDSELPINCKDFEADRELAFAMLSESGLVPEASFHDFERVSVRIHADDRFDGRETGHYSLNHIDLGRGCWALLHEMLHHWQTIHFVLDTGNHPGWDKNGYDTADHFFEQYAFKVRDAP